MKKLINIFFTFIIISAVIFTSASASAVEVNPKNRQKQFKNNAAVKFKNSAQITDLPESYSSSDLGYCTSVKSQVGDICWSYASISSMETAFLKNGFYTNPLSASALDKWGTTRENGEGWIREELEAGTTLIPIAYFMSRNGAVEENSEEVKYAANAISYYEKGDDNLIKLAIMRTGAVTANLLNDSFAFSKNREAYCITDPIENYGGHTVSVVGWDDNYSKDNFDGNYTPKNDGAWLCKNSWGPNRNKIGGYFWASYEDYYLFNNDYYDPSFAIEELKEIKDSEYLYQNEEFGATYSFNYINEKDVTYFNVFDFSENGNVLNKVMFETTAVGAKYKIYYTPLDENYTPVSDKNAWTEIKSGTVNYNGYICSQINDVILPRSKAAIAVEINTDVAKYNPNNNIGVSEWLRESGTRKMRFINTCEKGKSFVTLNGEVIDVKDFYETYNNDYIGGTLVIKALTDGKVDTDLKGDVDYSQTVNITDATLIQKHLAKTDKLDFNKLKNADFNGDGKVNIKDTTAIQKYLAS